MRRLTPGNFFLAFGLVLAIAVVGTGHVRVAGRTGTIISGIDPAYYFGVAHSLMFDHDFNLTNELAVLKPARADAGGFHGIHNQPGSPYAIGYSLLSIPFIGAGTIADGAAGHRADGYSTCVMYAYRLELVIFSVAGLFFLTLALERLGTSPTVAILLSLVMFFATSVGYYTFSPMSHASTFLASSAFVLCWLRVRESGRAQDWLLLGVVGGLLSICRWQDAIFLLAPPAADLIRYGDWTHWRKWAVYAAPVPVWWIPQFLEWKAIYGKYLLIPEGPGFLQFPPRYILKVLFSTNHGWFLWTPVTLLGVCGLIYAAVRISREYIVWLLVIALEVAVIGSMPTNWNCNDSFSIRSLTSCVPLVAIGLAFLLRVPAITKPLVAAIVVCAVFSTLFAIQFRLDLIPRQSELSWSQVFTDKLVLLKSPLRVLRAHSTEAAHP
ncbi:MAG: hypothetical protein JOZ62_18420 [Acidobacteriaceae bacterium]|nr:hypothetical protein [Acidobacteriaceae bacterium]